MDSGGKAAETVVATFIALSDGREPHQTFLPGLKGATSQSNDAGKGTMGKQCFLIQLGSWPWHCTPILTMSQDGFLRLGPQGF